MQATSGMMMLSGEEGDPPVHIGFPIVDTLTAQTAAIAILGALMKRTQSGEGSLIDVSMLDASLAFTTSALTPFLVTGERMKRMGNTGYSGLPTASLFESRDGRQVSLDVVQPNQFEALARYLGREEWLSDQRFSTPDARRANFEAMKSEIAAKMAQRHDQTMVKEMNDARIPCGLLRRVDEATRIAGDGALKRVKVAGLLGMEDISLPGIGFREKSVSSAPLKSPPNLDQDRDTILGWLTVG